MNIMRDETSHDYWEYFNNPEFIKTYKKIIVEPLLLYELSLPKRKSYVL